MFDNQDAPDETPSEPGSSDVPRSAGEQAEFSKICERLEGEVPRGIYIPDAWLAETLYLTSKTLANRRSVEKKGKKAKEDKGGKGGEEGYPIPMHPGGGRAPLHTRTAIIEFLAQQELNHIRRYRYRGS